MKKIILTLLIASLTFSACIQGASTLCPKSLEKLCGPRAIPGNYLMIDAKHMVCANIIKDTHMTFLHNYSIHVQFDDQTGKKIRDLTANNIGKPIAMFLSQDDLILAIVDESNKNSRWIAKDPHLLAIATIQAELGDEFRITGQTHKKAQLFINRTLTKACPIE